jgi:hypothetical protein
MSPICFHLYRMGNRNDISLEEHLENSKILLYLKPVFRIQSRRFHNFFILPDPDPLVRCTDPDTSNIKQK